MRGGDRSEVIMVTATTKVKKMNDNGALRWGKPVSGAHQGWEIEKESARALKRMKEQVRKPGVVPAHEKGKKSCKIRKN